MNTATIITLIALGIMLVDACPIVTSINGSCCEVKSNEFKFSTTPLKSRVYIFTILLIPVEIVKQQLKDIAMLLLMEEDGWWSKGDKMAVLILTEVG